MKNFPTLLQMAFGSCRSFCVGAFLAATALATCAFGQATAPIFVVPTGAPSGVVSEVDLSGRVPATAGLVGPYRFAFSGAKPEWVTLNGTVLRVAPPAGAAVTSVPIAVGLTVTDASAAVRPARRASV